MHKSVHSLDYSLLTLSKIVFLWITLPVICYLLGIFCNYATAESQINESESASPNIHDPNLSIQTVFKGIKAISNMAFAGPNDILYLERFSGEVKRIANGTPVPEPLLRVNVARDGLLGIAIARNETKPTYVFLYFIEALPGYSNSTNGKNFDHLSSRVYRYELIDNKLVRPKLLLALPAYPGPQHYGGELTLGPDNNLYLVIGDVDGFRNDTSKTLAQNYKNGTNPDGRAGILRFTQDGKAVGTGILGKSYPLNLYYAYGIRNSFGIDFDPVTGNLWETENGPEYGDEINLVKPGFNSGAHVVDGKPIHKIVPTEFQNFSGTGKYSNPEFSWGKEKEVFSVAPTAIKFLNSDKIGKQYENDMFVGDVNNGFIYHFDLNSKRTKLILNGTLRDKVADNMSELQNIVFLQGVRGITDLQVGPDGYLYILAQVSKDQGAIMKVLPLKQSSSQ